MRDYAVIQTTRVCEHCGPGLASVLVSTVEEIPRQPWVCARCGCGEVEVPAWAQSSPCIERKRRRAR